MLWQSTSTLEAWDRYRRKLRFSSHFPLWPLCTSFSIRSQFSRRGCRILGIVEETRSLSWVAPELLAVSGSWNSLASDKEFTLFCKSWIWVNNWLTVKGFLSWCIHNSSILACLARSASSQQVLLNSSIYWQSFAWCSRKSLLLISNSPYKLILSRWAWSAHWFACCSCNRWDSNSWLIS